MSAAYYLNKKQHPVLLFESNSFLGGKVRTLTEDNFVIEAAPDSFLTTKPEALELIKELGLEEDLIYPLHSNYFILNNGELKTPPPMTSFIPNDEVAFLQNDFFSAQATKQILNEKNIPAGKNDDESLADFITRRFGKEFLDNYAAPLFAGIHASPANMLSIKAALPHIKEMEIKYGSITAGVTALKTKNTGSLPMFCSFRKGMQTLIDKLTEKLSFTEILTENHIIAVKKTGDGKFEITNQHYQKYIAERIIFTTPAHITCALLASLVPSPHYSELSDLLNSIYYAGSAVLTLAFKKSDVAHPLNATGFLVPQHSYFTLNENKACQYLSACTFSSSKWADRAPENMHLLRCFFGNAEIKPGNSYNTNAGLLKDKEQLTKFALHNLAPLLGIKNQPYKSWLHAWEKGTPQYHVGHLQKMKRIKALLPENITVAGSSFGGIGIPDCIRQGREAAEL